MVIDFAWLGSRHVAVGLLIYCAQRKEATYGGAVVVEAMKRGWDSMEREREM